MVELIFTDLNKDRKCQGYIINMGTMGIVRRQFPSLRGTTLCNNGSSILSWEYWYSWLKLKMSCYKQLVGVCCPNALRLVRPRDLTSCSRPHWLWQKPLQNQSQSLKYSSVCKTQCKPCQLFLKETMGTCPISRLISDQSIVLYKATIGLNAG